MAGSINKVILIGNLGKDPEVRRLNSGDPVVSFTLATNETWRDKTTGERKERTEWHNIVIFNENLGKIAEQYCKKGTKVYLEGQIQTRKWQDQSGADRYTTEIVLTRFRGELQLLQLARRRRSPRQFPRRERFAQLRPPLRRRRAQAGAHRRRGRADRRRHSVLISPSCVRGTARATGSNLCGCCPPHPNLPHRLREQAVTRRTPGLERRCAKRPRGSCRTGFPRRSPASRRRRRGPSSPRPFPDRFRRACRWSRAIRRAGSRRDRAGRARRARARAGSGAARVRPARRRAT